MTLAATATDPIRAAVLQALRARSTSVGMQGATQVAFALGDDPNRSGWATADDRWLTVEMPMHRHPSPDDWWELLRPARALGPGLKLVQSPGGPAVVRGEMSLAIDETGSLFARTRRLLRDLQAAALLEEDLAAPADAADDAEESRDVPIEVVSETGWPLAKRDERRWVVWLESDRLRLQATLESRGGLFARVELGSTGPTTTQACRQAVTWIMAWCAASVRLIRPVLEPDLHGGWAAAFEVRLTSDAGAADIAHALSALSVACRLCATEIHLLLEDPDIAEEYARRCSSRDQSVSV